MKTAKITIIGGGSSYTPELIEGLIQRWKLIPLHELALVDVEAGKHKLETIAALSRRMLDKSGLEQVKISTHYNAEEAIPGSDYVLTQLRVGQLPARAADERLGLKYNLLGQETTGVGGFAKALRTVPVMLNIAKLVEKLAPKAWIINFTNPAGIVTEAVSRYTNAKIIGLCNVPITMHHMIANMLDAKYEDIQLRFAGLNHMVWAHEVTHKGENITKNVIDLLCNGAELTMNNIKEEPWEPNFLRALNAIPCPYHRYFYQTKAMLTDEIDQAKNEGTRAEQVMKVEEELFEIYADQNLCEKPEQLSFRGGSFYSQVAIELICAIHNNLGTRLTVNTQNNGTISGLPDDAVIETDCIVDSQGAHPLAFGHLPPAMHGLTAQIKGFERLTIEAAVHGDKESALLALVTNPLIGDAEIAKSLLEDVLETNSAYLPQFE